MTYRSVNPFDGKQAREFASHTDAQLETAIRAAETCFKRWRTTTFAQRAAIAAKAATVLRSQVERFARPMTLEMGKRIDEARGEVALSADIIEYYATNAERFLAPEKLRPRTGEAIVVSSPIGIAFTDPFLEGSVRSEKLFLGSMGHRPIITNRRA